MQTYLKNGYIVTMGADETVYDGSGVLVEGENIIAVGKIDPKMVKPDAEVIDLQGKYVLPGFVNTHVHTSQQISRGVGDDVDFMTWLHKRMWPYESNMTEEDSYVSTLMTSLELIRSGVTSFAEPGGQFVSGMARATAESGLRGKLLVHYETPEHDPCILNTVHFVNPITADSFKMKAPEGAKKVKVMCMDTLPYIPFTSRRDVELNVVDGVIQCDTDQDVLYIAQVERHGKNGNIGKAFMGGFHMKGGALASSVGHDNHNIIVMGDSFEDMALAVNRCAELGGGQVIVHDGKVAAEIGYPTCGLMSDLSLDEMTAQKKTMNAIAYEMGTPIPFPFLFLCFICLACIEAYAVTDKGFIDVEKGQIIDPILEVIE